MPRMRCWSGLRRGDGPRQCRCATLPPPEGVAETLGTARRAPARTAPGSATTRHFPPPRGWQKRLGRPGAFLRGRPPAAPPRDTSAPRGGRRNAWGGPARSCEDGPLQRHHATLPPPRGWQKRLGRPGAFLRGRPPAAPPRDTSTPRGVAETLGTARRVPARTAPGSATTRHFRPRGDRRSARSGPGPFGTDGGMGSSKPGGRDFSLRRRNASAPRRG